VHALEEYVLPFPQRLAFFSGLGMPPPTSGDYPEWLDRNAAGSYAMFLVSHPRFVVGTLWEKRGFFGTSFLQQYFPGTDTRYRETLLAIGELLHPETNAVYLLVFLLLGGLCVAAVRRRSARLRAWTWLLVWLLGTSSVVMMTSFFGDTEAYRRHLYPSVESIRLLMWLLVFFAFDEVVSAPGSSPSPASP